MARMRRGVVDDHEMQGLKRLAQQRLDLVADGHGWPAWMPWV
jgi:hypothetical protein